MVQYWSDRFIDLYSYVLLFTSFKQGGETGVRISHLPPGDDTFLTDLPSPTGRQTSFQWISHLPMGDRQIYLNLPSPSVKWLNSFLRTQMLVRRRADTFSFIIFYFEYTFYPFYLLQSWLPRNESIDKRQPTWSTREPHLREPHFFLS